ncbi:MAG: D-alanyl-D-alanine carboxypeptidase/D-alanyl-D-alanine-endopeptidase [Paludibacteraceae bacterium]|nr:D-alanyl-D-alanine carboxypeptidase/D-alanyl-D-alanine-endopeptidase [Paludibacteraceae bacterium]
MKAYYLLVLFFCLPFFAVQAQDEDMEQEDVSDSVWLADTLKEGTPLYRFAHAPNLEPAHLSVLVKNLNTGEVLADLNSQYDFIPASVTKVITTATALELLSDSFRFVTKLEYDGLITDSVLHGNVYVKGGGDPTFGSSNNKNPNTFFTLASLALREAGIKRIDGRVIGDASLFEESGTHPYWLLEDLGSSYSPTPSALSFSDNLFKLVIVSDSTSAKFLYIIPESKLFEPMLNVKLKNSGFRASLRLSMSEYSTTPLLSGYFPMNNRYATKIGIPDPALLVADSLTRSLIRVGIPVDSAPMVTRYLPKGGHRTKLYDYYSPDLKSVILQTNYKSINLYAENIFSYLALQKDSVSTSKVASQVIASYWKSKGLASEKIFQVDGSGMSMKNAINASFLVDVLTYMKTKSLYSSAFLASLPICGVNGTVKPFLKGTPLAGKVYAKSGSMERVQNYCGYINYNKNWYVFCIMINNYLGDRYTVRQEITSFLNSLMKETKNVAQPVKK